MSLLRLTPVVAGVSLASVLGMLAVREVVPVSELRASSDSLGNYLQTVGGIYAVLLAFVVYVVWGQFNESRGFVDREAVLLADVHRIASGLPVTARDEIQRLLSEYVDAVLAEEWQAMRKGNDAVLDRVGRKLDEVWVEIHRCRPDDECGHTIYGEVLSRFTDLYDVRANRLTAARTRIPLALHVLLYAGAIITIGSVYLLAFDQVWLHATVTAALSGAIAHVLYIIRDLDDAFGGDWQVSNAPFLRARRSFSHPSHRPQ
ncbi:MAG: DUF4239 domain-containing protein [Acidobacteriota bacterium]